jgi:hypothetical protein
MARHHLLAFTNPAAGREDEFNRWYDERHVPDLLAVPGFVSAQRFALTDATGQGKPGWTYLALYELDTDDPDALMAEVRARLGTEAMPVSDTLDSATAGGLIATALTTRVPAKNA